MFSSWLMPVRDKIPQDLTQEESRAFLEALWQEAGQRFHAFLSGIQAYQTNPASRVVAGDVSVVKQIGTTRLLDYAPDSKGSIVFVVPSLVNRFDILDLDQDLSFLRYLAGQGLRPLVIEWNEPGDEELKFKLSDYMGQRLEPLFHEASALAKDAPLHMLGYCMGGTLALALALEHQDKIASLTLMATPWDFAVKGVAGVPPSSTWSGQMFVKQAGLWEPYLDKIGKLPASCLQASFTAYQPLQILQKYSGFSPAATPDEEKQTRRFVLTEDWLNNGVPLAWPVAKECLHEWYVENLTERGEWKLADKKVKPENLALPVCLLIPKRDRIVPPECALALQKHLKDTFLLEPDRGHIGVMASEKAQKEVWEPLCKWIISHT